MTLPLRATLLITVFVGASAFACSPAATLPKDCGSFSFSPDAYNAGNVAQAKFQLGFLHKGSTCPITCNNYWFVQALKPRDLDSGDIIQPNDTQQDRTVTGQAEDNLNGWAIDRLEGGIFGWYKVDDDFKLHPSGVPGEVNQFGQGTTIAAQMHDTLNAGDKWGGKNVQVIGLTAAVSTEQGVTCEGKILGLKKWMVVFSRDANGQAEVSKPVPLDTTLSDQQAFFAAVEEWNKHLDGGDRARLPWEKESSAFAPLGGGQGG